MSICQVRSHLGSGIFLPSTGFQKTVKPKCDQLHQAKKEERNRYRCASVVWGIWGKDGKVGGGVASKGLIPAKLQLR